MSTRNDDAAGASRPFDRDRDGFVMAEGSAVLLLERLEDAVSRGARIYGEVAGYGLTSDAHHMTAPRTDAECATRAMTAAMREAGVAPSEVELIDAHGSATPLNDPIETLAIKNAFREAAYAIPVTASKGQHGHALGATGAWEAAISLLSMSEGVVPRVVNLEHDDPECDLPYVRENAPMRPSVVLSNSSGFGGINAALVFRRYDP
jgi:3-oxoacyl-[acyl-carrier-protein] synthase II